MQNQQVKAAKTSAIPTGTATKDITESAARGSYLGTDRHGFSYYSRPDFYVYQYNPAGECRGWIAHIHAWENSFTLLVNND